MTATAPREMVEVTADGRMVLHFHPGQQRAWDSEKRFVLVLAGSQSGKTTFGPHWLYREMQRKGPGDYMIVGPSFTLFQAKLMPTFIAIFDKLLGLGTIRTVSGRQVFVMSEEGSRKTFGDYDPQRPTRVLFGYAAKPDTLESATLLAAWCDESGQDDFKAGAWEAIRRRLSLSRGRVLHTTTPYNLGWLKQELYDPGMDGDPEIEVITFDSTENPLFPREEFEERERSLPRWKFNMMYRGLFERPAGLIYDCFSKNLHVVSATRTQIDPTWPRYVGMDYGLQNFAALIFAKDPTSHRFYLTDEYKGAGFTMREHVENIYTKIPARPDGTRPLVRAVGGAFSEDNWRREVTRAGLQVARPDQSSVEVGIQRVYAAFRRNEIMVLDRCTGFLDQIGTYSRKLDETNEPTEEIKDKETYHYCFVAGTMIDTSQGLMPIERVGRGTYVLTRDGYRQVATPGCRENQPLRRVTFSDGTVLVGTPDHPIWVSGSGFKAIDSLRYGDIIETVLDHHPGRYPWADARPSHTTASRIIATLMRHKRATAATSSDRAFTSIASFGKKPTGRSLTATMSTIGTAITAITRSTTSHLSPLATTNACTMPGLLAPQNWRISTASALSPPHGTAQRKARRGTANTPKRFMRNARPSNASVSSAGIHTGHDIEAQTASVPMLASPKRGGRAAWMMSSARARIAAWVSRSTSTPESGTAPVSVRSVQEWGSGTVYNMTVKDVHEYFANGVLVSNCDCMRYIVGTEMRHVDRQARGNRFGRRVRMN